MKTLVIEREAVKNNIGVIKERAGEAVIYAVLTGDGQGAGLVELARLLREEGIGRFAVSEPAEAAALRRAGFVEEEILMLRPTVDRAELEQLIDLNVVCTVGSADTGMALNGAAEARSTVVEAHIQIDTGMGFGGFLADEPEKILSVYRNLPNVAVSGICTQLHARKKGGEDLAARLGQFHRVVEAIRAAGFETGVVHAAGSYALLHCADARLDGVRAGSALLGRCRRVHGDGLYRVGYGEVGIEETRWLPKGHTVGSARPVVLRRPTRVAVLPVGYQNGFGVARAQGGGLGALLRRWLAARRRTVRVNGQRARILGAIGAIETVVDVTDLKCSAGDPAVFDIDPLYARLLVLLGVGPSDTEAQAVKLADKVCGLRIFEDENEKMNLNLEAVGGALLVVSQFTLYADTKSRRPGFTGAAKPPVAIPLYEKFMAECAGRGFRVEHGEFGADMKVELLNDGPFTLVLDSEEICR